MARAQLNQAGIPYFSREEPLSGLRLAFPAAPTPGAGVTWTLLVPESLTKEAKTVLRELHPDEYADALPTSKQLHPQILSMEQYLLSRGFDVKEL